MPTLARAIAIAAEAHAKDVDKGGEPYILHPIRVMLRLKSNEEMIAGVLHDVVEDSPDWTIERLAAEGFSPEIVEAIDALTKRPGETRIDAAKRLVSNSLARAVKLADNAENMDLTRIANPTAKDYARRREYEKVRAILMGTPISREQARKIALETISTSTELGATGVSKVVSLDELGPDRLNIYWTSNTPMEQCWIACLDYPVTGLQSSRVILIAKVDGEVVYAGSAGDEG